MVIGALQKWKPYGQIAQNTHLVFVDMLNEPLMHQQYMGPSRNIRMNRHREDEFIILAVEVVEMVLINVRPTLAVSDPMGGSNLPATNPQYPAH